EDGVVALVDGDGPVEGAVDGDAPQQTGPLDEVVVGAPAHDDRAQPQSVPGAGGLHADAGEQAADTPEPAEADVSAGRPAVAGAADDVTELAAQEVLERGVATDLEATTVQPGDVDGGGAQVEAGERLEHREGVADVELDVDAAGEAVRLEDVGRGLAQEGAAVDRGDHTVLPIQAPHEGDHGLGLGLALGPLGQVLVCCG